MSIKGIWIPTPIQWDGRSKNYNGKVDRMMTKREICEAFGITPTNSERYKIYKKEGDDPFPEYEKLREYSNPYHKYAVFKASEVQDLLDNLEIDRSKN